jgi:hypothetical protein
VTLQLQQLQQDMANFSNVFGTATSVLTFQIQRSYPNFAGAASQVGSTIPGVTTVGPNGTSQTGGFTSSSGAFTPGMTPVQLNVNVQGDVNGPGGVNGLVNQISTGLRKLASNITPGSANAWGSASRYSGRG